MQTEHAFPRLRAIKQEYVDETLGWYRKRSTWPRLSFRAAGLLVIVVSLSLPLLSTACPEVVPYASLTIAIATSLNAFFGWQRLWEKRISIAITIEAFAASWETALAKAELVSDSVEGFAEAAKATQDLIAKVASLTASETNAFFAAIKSPKGETDAEKPVSVYRP